MSSLASRVSKKFNIKASALLYSQNPKRHLSGINIFQDQAKLFSDIKLLLTALLNEIGVMNGSPNQRSAFYVNEQELFEKDK